MFSYTRAINKIIVWSLWLVFFTLPFASFSSIRITNMFLIVFLVSTVLSREFYTNIASAFDNRYTKFVTLFFLVWPLFLFNSENIDEAVRIITVNISLWFAPFLICRNAGRFPNRSFLENAYLAGLIFSTLFTFREGLKFYENGTFDHLYFESLLVMHRPYYGMFLLVGIFICLNQLISPENKNHAKIKAVLLAIAIYFILFMVLIYVKMAFAVLIILLIIWFVSVQKKRRASDGRILKYAVILTLILVVPVAAYLITNTDGQMAAFFMNSFNERINLWTCGLTSIDGIKDLMVGGGFGDEIALVGDCYQNKGWISPDKNVHNQYISFILNNGIIGLFLFLGVIFTPLGKAIREKDSIAFFFMLIILAGGLTENTFHRFNGVILFATFSSIYYFIPSGVHDKITSS